MDWGFKGAIGGDGIGQGMRGTALQFHGSDQGQRSAYRRPVGQDAIGPIGKAGHQWSGRGEPRTAVSHAEAKAMAGVDMTCSVEGSANHAARSPRWSLLR